MKKYNLTQSDKNQVAQWIDFEANTRSAWGRGVKQYALDLVETLPDDWKYTTADELESALLNGADDWSAYSWTGCSLIYNCDICERLTTPSQQKRKKYGDLEPNGRESWLDLQTRALYQAFRLIRRICISLTD